MENGLCRLVLPPAPASCLRCPLLVEPRLLVE